jgi:hypothetical protein
MQSVVQLFKITNEAHQHELYVLRFLQRTMNNYFSGFHLLMPIALQANFDQALGLHTNLSRISNSMNNISRQKKPPVQSFSSKKRPSFSFALVQSNLTFPFRAWERGAICLLIMR